MAKDINKVKATIRALTAKAKDGASTEAEMMVSLERAGRMAAEFGLDLDDLQDDSAADNVRKYGFPSNDGKDHLHEVDSLLGVGIANFCDVKPWRTNGDMFYCGLDADVELAAFVRTSLKRVMEHEYAMYKAFIHTGPIKGARYSFMLAFANRIIARMEEVKAKTAHFSRDSKALITRKGGLIEMYMEKEGIGLGKAKRSKAKPKYNASAAQAGKEAGARADIGRAAGNKATALLT